MPPSIDTEAAIKLVQQDLERHLAYEEEHWLGPEDTALEKARRSGIVEPDGMGMGQILRDPNGGFVLLRGRPLDMDKLDHLLKAAAAGDKDADLQVTAIALWFLERGQSPPPAFHELEISLWRKRLPKPRRKDGRDFRYCMEIHRLQQYGFSPTRNRALHGDPDAPESGCSILKKALARMGIHVSEHTLEKIWEKNAWRR